MAVALQKIWSLFTAKEKRRALFMMLLALAMAFLEALGVLSIMPFLSVLSRPEAIQEQPMLSLFYSTLKFNSAKEFIGALGIISITTVLIASACKTVTQHLLNRFVHLQRHEISSRLLSRYLDQPYEFFLGRNSAELAKNVLSEADQIMFSIIQPLSQLIAQAAIVLTISLVIVFYDPLTAFVVLTVIGALYAFIYTSVRRRLGKIGHEVVEANKERYTSCSEAVSGIRDIKMTNASEAYLKRYKNSSRTYARHFAASDTLSQTPLYMAEATGYTGLILISLYLLTRNDHITQVLPALGLYGFAAYRLLPAVQIMYRGVARLRFTSAALNNIHRDLMLSECKLTKAKNSISPNREIRLQNIHFSYPADPQKPIFHDYNLTIKAHSITGIAGKSGSGKSTLMDLLLGLIQPQQGCLWIDDILIDHGNIQSWRQAIGYVPQHIYLADSSVASNIAFGIPSDQIDMGAVAEAAKAAQIHDFIVNDLPEAYSSRLGDRGIRLSGGQRQRIGIARALYRNPSVIFMDEATSALDDETEKSLNDAIKNISKDKTIILIAHRQATLNQCEHVINL